MKLLPNISVPLLSVVLRKVLQLIYITPKKTNKTTKQNKTKTKTKTKPKRTKKKQQQQQQQQVKQYQLTSRGILYGSKKIQQNGIINGNWIKLLIRYKTTSKRE